jgi:hypothetical protein
MKVILAELGGVPYLDNEELKDARETAITLELTNRFAFVHGELWNISQRTNNIICNSNRSSRGGKNTLGPSEAGSTSYSPSPTCPRSVGIVDEACY